MTLLASLWVACAGTTSFDPALYQTPNEPWQRPATIDEFFDSDWPRVIAHRGFSAQAPENTLVAIEKAIEIQADMVEFDVTVSRDGEIVVIHDETLDRTTDGTGLVADFDLEDLRRLDAGAWFAENSAAETFVGERIPTLREVLDATRGRILVNVEIKTEAAETAPAPVAQLLREYGMVDQAIVSSFSPRALELMRQIAPEIRRASLYNKDLHSDRLPSRVTAPVEAQVFHVKHSLLTAEMLEDAADAGLPVAVYTVNEAPEMRHWIERGAAALFTDRPDVMIELIRPRDISDLVDTSDLSSP